MRSQAKVRTMSVSVLHKNYLVSPQILAAPSRDPQDLFILETDASDDAIGGQLLQMQKGKRKMIGYASFGLTPV